MVINPTVGVYIPIIRIPIKGWMTIPNTRSLDPSTHAFRMVSFHDMTVTRTRNTRRARPGRAEEWPATRSHGAGAIFGFWEIWYGVDFQGNPSYPYPPVIRVNSRPY